MRSRAAFSWLHEPLNAGRSNLAGLVAVLLVVCSATSFAAEPNPPVPTSPVDGGVGVEASPSLCVGVSDPDGDPMTVRFFARDLNADPEAEFTLIGLPDTQYYPQMYPHIFDSQINWIVENRKTRNIVFVSHVGDIVQVGDNLYEWENAVNSMALLEDPATTELEEGIPYGLSVGNHDQAPNNNAGTPVDPGETTGPFNQSFGVDRFQGRSYWGDNYGLNNDNGYQVFRAGGIDFLIFHLEFDDDFLALFDGVLDWMESVIQAHPDHEIIVTTHSILCTRTTCPDYLEAEFSTQGELLYERLKGYTNLQLMMCGHAGTTRQQPRRADTFDGHTIHTILMNYQRLEYCPFRCGRGFLRILTFKPELDRIDVETYSPWLDEYKTEACTDGNFCHNFSLPYNMDGGRPYQNLGELTNVSSGVTACLPWSGREDGREYEWYAEAIDGEGRVQSTTSTFTSDGGCTLNSDCEDGDACTTDTCSNSQCVRTSIASCCTIDADCNDDNWCTDDTCNGGSCQSSPNTRACNDGDDCTDGDVCSGGSCAGNAISCDDGNSCTSDQCVAGDCESSYAPAPECCSTTNHCDDGNPCTIDSCDAFGDCLNIPDPTCCNVDSDCDDTDVCTVDRCSARNNGALRLNGVNAHVVLGEPLPNSKPGRPSGPDLKEFTLEAWINWDGTGVIAETANYIYQASDVGGVEAYPIITKGREDRDDLDRNVNFFMGVDPVTNLLVADLEAGITETTSGQNYPVVGVTPITTGSWHHVAATYDGRCWQLYLDGVAETDGTVCPDVTPAITIHQTGLGTSIDQSGDVRGRFGGLIDEVRLWRRARTPAEIADGMGKILDPDADMVMRFSLDSITPEFTVIDSSGYDYFGAAIFGEIESDGLVDFGGGQCTSRVAETVVGFRFEDGDDRRLLWFDQPGMSFDIISGTLAELALNPLNPDVRCLSNDLDDTLFNDFQAQPGPGEGYFYLIRAVGPCAAGSYGDRSDGSERTVIDDCPE